MKLIEGALKDTVYKSAYNWPFVYREYLRYFALFFLFYAQIKRLYGLLLLDLVPYRNPLEHPNDHIRTLQDVFDVLDTVFILFYLFSND